ncbi:hypothetical protein [Robertmurraya kyonggiensis]|uniref:hypothetical protein n=1 Tax=Robertmurraya kyonggiensis TaxID=1037680 RepID=UPI00130E894E|nr:hypothetical protein [Robertmurraya kyonggiensis]
MTDILGKLDRDGQYWVSSIVTDMLVRGSTSGANAVARFVMKGCICDDSNSYCRRF